MNSWLTTSQLCRYYRRGPQEIRAVDNVDITIRRGEFLGVVGASGSGKSTLLNLLAGLDTPTSGTIEFENVSLGSLSRRELSAYRARSVGMVFQSFNLLHYKTAQENVEVALYFSEPNKALRKQRAEEMLVTLGLADRIDHRPADLSGGEQQRVAVARALVKQPEILFADEPTGNLDHDNALQIAELLAKLNREGLTILLVTHNLELARDYCSRIITMNYGKVIDDSTGNRDA